MTDDFSKHDAQTIDFLKAAGCLSSKDEHINLIKRIIQIIRKHLPYMGTVDGTPFPQLIQGVVDRSQHHNYPMVLRPDGLQSDDDWKVFEQKIQTLKTDAFSPSKLPREYDGFQLIYVWMVRPKSDPMFVEIDLGLSVAFYYLRLPTLAEANHGDESEFAKLSFIGPTTDRDETREGK